MTSGNLDPLILLCCELVDSKNFLASDVDVVEMRGRVIVMEGMFG